MTTLRRSALLVLIALATVLATVLGATGPASATFDNNTTTTARIGTATIAPPTAVTAQMTSCSNSRTQTVLVSWAASTSKRVSGYTVAILNSAGTTISTVQVGATTTSATVSLDKLNVDPATLTFTTTTLTDYGWTATSPRKAPLPC